MGPSGSGKSTIWRTLKRANELLGKSVHLYLVNPKAMPRTMLLGSMNHSTREFSEGVLTSAAKDAVRHPQDELCWVVLDGDIDPEWVESLNSVLDDNRLLTLPTGERISFGRNVTFLFETDSLQFASPATVSRMGMIYLNSQDVSLRALIGGWHRRLPESQQAPLQPFLTPLEKIAEGLIKKLSQCELRTTAAGLANNLLSLLPGKSSPAEVA